MSPILKSSSSGEGDNGMQSSYPERLPADFGFFTAAVENRWKYRKSVGLNYGFVLFIICSWGKIESAIL
jgi:hypothetical protein